MTKINIMDDGTPYPYALGFIDNGYKLNIGGQTKQTAVNFLVNYMLENFHLTDEALEKFEQAKQMEKDQIIDAFYEGMKTNPFDPNRGRGTIYYNETYNQNK